MQRFVLFDLDNTLVDRSRTLASVLTAFADRHGLGDDQRAELMARFAARATPADFAAIRERYRLAPGWQQLWRKYVADMASMTRCPAEVLQALEELRAKGWRIGVATNGSSDIQRAKLHSTGIARRVDAVCVSEECGVRKPDVQLFARAAECCGARPGSGWMVGDDPVNDIAGGRAAGLRTIWIGDTAQWPEHLNLPDYAVPTARRAIDVILDEADKGSIT